MAEEKIIGIDLGTTYSCAAVWQNDGVEVIPNEQGLRTTPSMVAFTGRERLVGDAAKHQVANNAANTLFDVKRLIGRRFSEATVQEDMKLWPFNVVRGDDDQALLQVQHRGRSRSFVPEEISSMLLTKMKNTAEEYLGAPVSRAVITVPAYFNDSQRRATKDAATIAGLEAVRIMNEPSAAALAYGISNSGDAGAAAPKTILVFDLGGGTFDVSVLTFRRDEFVVKGVAGDMHLGGEDFDHRLVSHFVAKFVKKNPQAQPDISGNAKALRRLRAECEKAKRNLSVAVETVIDIEALHQGLDFRMKLSRAKFEELNADLFQRCIDVVAECIAEVGLRKSQIDEIVLVGGSSRIPKVMEMLSEFFGGKQLCRSMNPDEAVAIGAAYQGAALGKGAKQSFVLQDVTPLSLGVEVNNGAMQVLVKRNTAVPCAGKKVVSTLFDNQTEAAFRVFEGERPMVADNHFLGELVLTGIPRERAGIPRMKVLFQVDADGILKVSAQETKTGVSTQTTIKNDGGRLNAAQIQRMVADAERFKKFDEEAKQSHQAKNELQCFIHNMSTRLAERKRMRAIEPGLATHIERGLSAADDWVEEEDMYGHSHSHRFASKLAELKSLCKPLLRERS